MPARAGAEAGPACRAQGDIAGNTFADNACAGGKGAALFRTVSSGALGADQGLNPDTDVRAPLAHMPVPGHLRLRVPVTDAQRRWSPDHACAAPM